MADEPNNLVLEHLRRLREQNEQILDAIRYMHSQQHADRLAMRGMQVSLDSNNDLLVGLTARVARIERRLELDSNPIPAGLAEPHHPFEPQPKKR